MGKDSKKDDLGFKKSFGEIMKSLAIIGVRGIPVVYSGFETFAEELSVRLAKRKWKVSVFCRNHVTPKSKLTYKGVELIRLPSINTRSLDTISHSLISTLFACFMSPRPEVIYYLGVGSSICSFFPRWFGIKTVVNVDGLDWKRGKWGKFAQWFLKSSEIMAMKFSNLTMTDSEYIKAYYKRSYDKILPVIPYGYSPAKSNKLRLRKFGLASDKYLVWTGRLVPDNHLDELLKAYGASKVSLPLIVLGDSPNEDAYKANLHSLATSRVVFLGFVGRDDYAAIVANSYAYIETKRSGGTHPSLVESMGHGCFILANDHSSHRGVLADTALYYKKGNIIDLKFALETIVSKKFMSRRQQYKKITKERAMSKYEWEAVVDDYVKLFEKLVS